MKSNFVAALSGALFAVGLAVSGMTKPEKVIGFLDLAGPWDASLAFVMVGAILVYGLLSRVIGAAIFGIGWGLGGFCPGPGLVSATTGGAAALVFVLGMTLGTLGEHVVARIRSRQSLQAGLEAPRS